MKTLKTWVFAGVSVLLLLACEDPVTEVITNPPTVPPPNFEAVFTGKNPTVTPYVVPDCGRAFRHEFRGEGKSDQLGAFTIVKRYCFEGEAATSSSYMTTGEFTLAAKGSADTIVGTYYGNVSVNNGYSILREELTITGGTGKYYNANGYLSVNTSGREELSGKIIGRIRLESSPPAS